MVATITCPAGHTKVWKKGYVPSRTGRKARYICYECGRSFYAPDAPKPAPKKPEGKKRGRPKKK